MEKITFTLADDQMVEFYVLEQTVLGGISYILVTDSEDDEAEALILKDLSKPGDDEALYEIVDDDDELEAVSKIFQEMLDDIEFEKLNELEINCIRETNNKYVNKALRDIGKMLEKKFTQVQLWAVSRAKHITVFSDFPVGLAIIGNSDTSLQGYKEISYRPISPLTRCLQNEMKKHRQIHYGIQCKIAFAECVLNDEENRVKEKGAAGWIAISDCCFQKRRILL